MDLSEDWLAYHMFDDILDCDDTNCIPKNFGASSVKFSHCGDSKIFFDTNKNVVSISVDTLKKMNVVVI